MAAQILVVDDEKETSRRPCGGLFGQRGVPDDQMLRPAEALRLAENGCFDLAILDVMMPQMDGFTFAGRYGAPRFSRHHALPPRWIIKIRSWALDLARRSVCDQAFQSLGAGGPVRPSSHTT